MNSLPHSLQHLDKQLGIENLEDTQTVTLTAGQVRKAIEDAWSVGYDRGEDYSLLPKWFKKLIHKFVGCGADKEVQALTP